MALDTRAIRIEFYNRLAYHRWCTEFSAELGKVMAVYAADYYKAESIRKRLRYGR